MAADDSDDNYMQEDASPSGMRINGGSGAEALTRIELDIAYSSEKLLNLEILLMLVTRRANDFEAVNVEYEDFSDESVTKAFESDILSGILDMEVKELQSFMSFLQNEIMEAQRKFSHGEYLDESAAKVEELDDAEKSVKKLQDSVADIRKQSSKFERILALCHDETRFDEGEELENGHLSSISTKRKPQTVDQQRHVLQMLEKSLARELDLEQKLSESTSNEEYLKLRLLYTERELYLMEESMELCLEREIEAENAAKVLLGVSKELAGKLQLVQLNLNSSLHREREMSSKLQDCMTQMLAAESPKERLRTSALQTEDGWAAASSEVLTLKEKVTALEEQLRNSDIGLQLAKVSAESGQQQQSALQPDLNRMQNVINGLKAEVLRTESRAQSAEAMCIELRRSNIELNEQILFLQNSESERTSLLERRCKESDIQLEHAIASVDALEEQKSGLYAAITDMQNMIEDLKTKVSKAESRAESVESKCTLLTDTNLELNEERGFLRGRLEYLKRSLLQAESAKIATSEDIGIRTKVISDLVMKLALERERLHLQISSLIKKNKILNEKLRTRDNARSSVNYKGASKVAKLGLPKSSVEALAESSTTVFEEEKLDAEKSLKTTVSADESSGSDSKIETAVNIEAAQLGPKYFWMAILVLSVAVLTFYVYQLEGSRP